jgi:hypothetical protein
VLVQQRKSFDTINTQSLVVQQVGAEMKKQETQLQDALARVDALSREVREANEKYARLDKVAVQLQAALVVQQEARQAAENRVSELSHDLQFCRANVEAKASAAELAELVHILQRLQANKAEKSGVAELAKTTMEHRDRLQEQGQTLHDLSRNAHASQTQLTEAMQQIQQRVTSCATTSELEQKIGKADAIQQLQVWILIFIVCRSVCVASCIFCGWLCTSIHHHVAELLNCCIHRFLFARRIPFLRARLTAPNSKS